MNFIFAETILFFIFSLSILVKGNSCRDLVKIEVNLDDNESDESDNHSGNIDDKNDDKNLKNNFFLEDNDKMDGDME
ncbi:319_t:CDS:2 [Entrophospora sp. SA101]|nr:319_t:CDS:2 [Entrophospora sp. SA101]